MRRMAFISRVVRNHADSNALIMEVSKERHDQLAISRVKVARRLIGQQKLRAPNYRAQLPPLLLTARRWRRIMD